jgi:hypothetical protein
LGLDTKFAPLHAGDGIDFTEHFFAPLIRIHTHYLYY